VLPRPQITLDYWRIWYYLLESLGLAVALVNSSQARQLAGRPKTDLLTELPDVSAAQGACTSHQPVIGCPKDPDRQAVAVFPPARSPRKPDIHCL